MSLVSAALEQMLLAKIANSGITGTHKHKVGYSAWTVSALLAFVGICFLIAAAFIWLLHDYNLETATAITGLLIIFFGLLIALGAWSIHEYKMSKLNHYKNEFTGFFESLTAPLAQEFEQPIRDNPKTAIALSILMGFLLSKHVL